MFFVVLGVVMCAIDADILAYSSQLFDQADILFAESTAFVRHFEVRKRLTPPASQYPVMTPGFFSFSGFVSITGIGDSQDQCSDLCGNSCSIAI